MLPFLSPPPPLHFSLTYRVEMKLDVETEKRTSTPQYRDSRVVEKSNNRSGFRHARKLQLSDVNW